MIHTYTMTSEFQKVKKLNYIVLTYSLEKLFPKYLLDPFSLILMQIKTDTASRDHVQIDYVIL